MTTISRQSRPPSLIRSLLRSGAGGGLLLIAAAALALIVANSPLAATYFGLLHSYVGPLEVLHWINELLMALFFLLIGLEVKREFLDGQLATPRRRVLPGLAALGGVVVPAAIYLALNGPSGDLRGWAVPVATDIPFALGVLALLGTRVPVSLRIFLTALAIIDDLVAVMIIAFFYTGELSVPWLAAAALAVLLLVGLNRAGVRSLAPYLLVGAVLWVLTYLSGVHATLAGLAVAGSIPIRCSPGAPDDCTSPLHRIEQAIQPWVTYLVIPVFGFANAGVSLVAVDADALLHPVTLGVAAGLFVGKQVGVFVATFAAVRTGLADTPKGATMLQVYGVSLLCGIGFTMSLFIGLLAFPEDAQAQVKLGVLAGSLLSALAGAAVLAMSSREATATASRRFVEERSVAP